MNIMVQEYISVRNILKIFYKGDILPCTSDKAEYSIRHNDFSVLRVIKW